MIDTLLLPGTKTLFGEVAGIGIRDGERYYFMIDKIGMSLMPAIVVECPGVQNREPRI